MFGVDRYKEAWWPKRENFEGFSFLRNASYGYTEADVTEDWTKSIVTIQASVATKLTEAEGLA